MYSTRLHRILAPEVLQPAMPPLCQVIESTDETSRNLLTELGPLALIVLSVLSTSCVIAYLGSKSSKFCYSPRNRNQLPRPHLRANLWVSDLGETDVKYKVVFFLPLFGPHVLFARGSSACRAPRLISRVADSLQHDFQYFRSLSLRRT